MAGMVMLQSCLPEHKVAKTFIDSPHMINLLVNPPAMVFKFNHKGEAIEDFDSLKPIIQDSLLWTNSRYMQYMNDSVLLENYMNNFIEGLRLNGFNVYLNTAIDSFSTEKPQSYVLDVSQVQLDEYLYPLEDEDSFLDTIYIKKFKLNAVDFSCWLNLGKAGSASGKKTTLYATNTAYDTFDGRFFNDPFSGTVRYKYNIDTLKTKDIYEMATYLGTKHAGYVYDFFLNQYIARNLPEGVRMDDYYHYNRSRKNLVPANEDRFEILGAK
jgi:hypothetical protein